MIEDLVDAGLNLVAILPTAQAADVADSLRPWVEPYPSLVLVGSAGPAMWPLLGDGPNPIDEHAAATLRRWAARFTDRGVPVRVGWPTADHQHLPVSALGRLAGWGSRSPLGLGMHPVHGMWFGYRGVLLVGEALPERREPAAPHPCDSCADRPCISACPVGAIGAGKGIDADTCFPERLRPGARCGSTCLARLACPVGVASRYPDAQTAHHQASGNRLYALWSTRRVPHD